MDSIINANIFFFISSIGFIILWVILAVLLVYVIRATKSFQRIMDKVEKDIDNIGDTTQEMLEEVRDSAVFHFLFRRKKKKVKNG